MTALVVAGACMAGVFIRWAVLNDEADAHLYHGPNSNCTDCKDK